MWDKDGGERDGGERDGGERERHRYLPPNQDQCLHHISNRTV